MDDAYDATQSRLGEIARHIMILDAMIEAQALVLVDEYRARRTPLQDAARRAGARKTFCSLNLAVRRWKGTMEIYWFESHVSSSGRTRFQAVPRSQNRRAKLGYSLTTLRARARDFEWDLVVETETRAHQLRCRFKAVVDLRRAMRNLARRYETKIAQLPNDQPTVLASMVPLPAYE